MFVLFSFCVGLSLFLSVCLCVSVSVFGQYTGYAADIRNTRTVDVQTEPNGSRQLLEDYRCCDWHTIPLGIRETRLWIFVSDISLSAVVVVKFRLLRMLITRPEISESDWYRGGRRFEARDNGHPRFARSLHGVPVTAAIALKQ